MKDIHIFDLDDCIIMHHGRKIRYDKIIENPFLTYYLNSCDGEKYIYTNGTYDHANDILNGMKINNKFKKIYSRDTVNTMKPDINSALDVQQDIITIEKTKNNNYIFYDDQIVNLQAAKKIGWKTVWIHPKYYHYKKYSFIDNAYSNLTNALRNNL